MSEPILDNVPVSHVPDAVHAQRDAHKVQHSQDVRAVAASGRDIDDAIYSAQIWIPFGDHPLELERYREN